MVLTRAILPCRGQLGLSEEQQKKALELRHMTNGVAGEESSAKESPEANGTDGAPAGGCCQGNGGGLSCCQSDLPEGKQDESIPAEQNLRISKTESVKESVAASKGRMKICRMPTWFETWDKSDTYTTLAVVGAAAVAFVVVAVVVVVVQGLQDHELKPAMQSSKQCQVLCTKESLPQVIYYLSIVVMLELKK